MSDEVRCKVVMLGDSGVGKTALVSHISKDSFPDAHTPTIGSQFTALTLEIQDRKLTLELWDTAGQEVYRSLVGFYTRDAKGAFLVMDVTREDTFQGLHQWITWAIAQAPGIKILIFANKIDLAEDRCVSSERIQDLAKSKGVDVVEGSAKLGHNTRDAFEQMGVLMLAEDTVPPATIIIRGEDLKKNKPKQGCC
jgi:small GTP-binding protein